MKHPDPPIIAPLPVRELIDGILKAGPHPDDSRRVYRTKRKAGAKRRRQS